MKKQHPLKGRKQTPEHIAKRMKGSKVSWFKKGCKPQNPIKKGEHRGFKTEFKKGQKAKNWNGFKKGNIPWCDKGGIKSFSKSHRVWLEHNQLPRVPHGCVIHHRDMNHENNDIDNLLLLTRGIHIALHDAHRRGKI